MPSDIRTDEQLRRYGAWLEDHLGTTLRPQTELREPEGLPDRSGRRWALVLLGCAASIAVIVAALVVLPADKRNPTALPLRHLTNASGRIDWAAQPAGDAFGSDEPVALTGGRAGFLALTRPYEPDPEAATRAVTPTVWYSPDGDGWSVTTPPIPTGGSIESVAATTSALWLLGRPAPAADGSSGMARLYRTTDGQRWTTLTPSVLVTAPLRAAGDVLLAEVFEDVSNGSRIAASTNGQDWIVSDAFPPASTIVSTAGTDGTAWVLRTGDEGSLSGTVPSGGPAGAVLMSSNDGVRWDEHPAPQTGATQLLGDRSSLVAFSDQREISCIGAGAGTEVLDSLDAASLCSRPPLVEWYDSVNERWTKVASSLKPISMEDSPALAIGGHLVSATIDYRGTLLVSDSSDGGSTWAVPEAQQAVSIGQGPFTPMLASTGRDVVAMAKSAGGRGAAILVGHLVAPVEVVPAPLPTDAPGPTLSPDTPLPGATEPDPAQATFPLSTDVIVDGSSVPLTITFRLDDTTLVGGQILRGIVDVVNPQDRPVYVDSGGCRADFLTTVSNGTITISAGTLTVCVTGGRTFLPGTNTFLVTVSGSYQTCTISGPAAAPDSPACDDGGLPPPLPPGRYTVTLQNPIVGVTASPPSIDIEVVAP